MNSKNKSNYLVAVIFFLCTAMVHAQAPQYPPGVRGSTHVFQPEQGPFAGDTGLAKTTGHRISVQSTSVGGLLELDAYIPAKNHLAVRFDHLTQTLQTLISEPDSLFSQTVQSAIAKAPRWLQNDLRHVFRYLRSEYQVKWADAILAAQDPYIDEVAFCIAHLSPQYLMSSYAYPQLLADNARLIYENDASLSFVRVVDYGSSQTDPDYYSTTVYRKARYIDTTEVTVPKEIYYWYIVHPKITDEIPAYINPDVVEDNYSHRNNITTAANGFFWRDFLFNRSDAGYASVKDLLKKCRVVWNAFPSPPNAAPHAMEMLNRWMGSSMKFTSNEERPHQPVRIYRKHIGRCGENGDLRVAIARSALIPAASVASYSTDHVWDEFWEEKWIHWDDAINTPFMYVDDWKKQFGTVFKWRSDGFLFPVTERYARDYCTLHIYAVDAQDRPIDGARVILYTAGLDNTMWFDTYGTTDLDGKVSFVLGVGRSYSARMSCDLGSVPESSELMLQVVSETEDGREYLAVMRTKSARPSLLWHEHAQPVFSQNSFSLDIDVTIEDQILRGADPFDDLDQNAWHFVAQSKGKCNFIVMNESEYDQYLACGEITGYNALQRIDSLASNFSFDGSSDLIFLWDNSAALHTAQHIKGAFRLYAAADPSIQKVSILSNYPNPYRPESGQTSIQFQLPVKAKTEVSIFNILGQKVITLIDAELYAGSHKVLWNGQDRNDVWVGSGVYFARVRTLQGECSQKMLVIH